MNSNNSSEELNYILEFVDDSITQFIDEVLDDCETDPEFSAVTLGNTINCYNTLLKTADRSSFKSLHEFFLSHGYSENDFEIFIQKRDKESSYYNGKQYRDIQDK